MLQIGGPGGVKDGAWAQLTDPAVEASAPLLEPDNVMRSVLALLGVASSSG